jgi:TRAP-type C4-dicarboxylate transport system permease small subunit
MNLPTSNSATLLNTKLESLLALLLFALFMMVVVLVVLRYVFNSTIIGGNEATVIAFVYTTAIGSAISIYRDEHIAISYFTDKCSAATQSILARLQLILIAILNLVLTTYAVIWIDKTGGFLMPAMGLPQIVAQLSIPIAGLLSVFYCYLRYVEIRKSC